MMMKSFTASVVLAVLGSVLLTGCTSSGTAGGDTSDAVKQVAASSDKGGATPDPNLAKPMGASPGGAGGPARTGKFRTAMPGGG
jgi:predicted small secreted protein